MDILSDCYSLVAGACGVVLLLFGGNVAMEDPPAARAAVATRGGVAISIAVIYVLLYVTYNLYMPNKQATISDLAGKELRATVMSADSLAQTVVVSVVAPLLGLLGDKGAIGYGRGGECDICIQTEAYVCEIYRLEHVVSNPHTPII